MEVWLSTLWWACILMTTPTSSLFVAEERNASSSASTSSSSASESAPAEGVVEALNKVVEVLASHESHTSLYERVALLEQDLHQKQENEARLEAEVLQLKTRIPALEEEIGTIPKMRKDLADFEAKIEKLVHDYEAKLSTLASEVIRLKKNGARRKDLETLSDQSDVLLRHEGPMCPEVGLGMFAERVGDQCLYFSWGSELNWTSAHRQCQSLRGDLAAPQDLLPLKNFLHRAFARGPSIWLGASYDLDEDDMDNMTLSDVALQDASVNLTLLEASGPSTNLLEEEEGDTGSIRLQQDEAGSFTRLMEGRGILLRSHRFPDNSGEDGEEEGRAPFLGSLRPDTSVVDVVLLADMAEEERAAEEEDDDELTIDPLTLAAFREPRESDGEEASTGVDSLSSLRTDQLTSPSAGSGENPDAPTESGPSPGSARDERAAVGESFVSLGSHPVPLRHERGEDSHSKRNGKPRMKCMLLQQNPSLEYELVGKPCNELHRFACAIESIDDNIDRKFAMDNLLNAQNA